MKSFKEYIQEQILNESADTITTVDGSKSLRPGTKKVHTIVKEHPSYVHPNTKEEHKVFTVKQPNGFHGVLVTDKNRTTVLSCNHNNLTKDKAIEAGEHYSKHGLVGLKNWYYGGDKILKEDAQIDEAKLSPEYYEKLASYHDMDANLKGVGKNVIDNAKKMSIRAKESAEMLRSGRGHDQAYRHYQGL